MALLLVFAQIGLLAFFSYFAFFNYLYTVASFFYKKPRRVEPSGKRVAIVIVSFNEGDVLLHTIKACEEIDYPNKTIIVGDDSNDGKTYRLLVDWIRGKGGKKVARQYVERHHGDESEVWQTREQRYVLFHRHSNQGFKAGNLKEVIAYLERQGIDYMYLLDSDWHPEPAVLKEALAVLEADPKLAYVQTRRDHFNRLVGAFQNAVSISEEAEYYVDLVGRQTLGHPILFTGCCTLFRLKAIDRCGGFTPGHLTEDIDLTNRLYLHGWRATYIPYVGNHGEVPPSYRSLIKQQERWAMGTARTLREFLVRVFGNPHLHWMQTLSLIRQNMYYATAIAIELSLVLAVVTVSWLVFFPESYQANLYLYYMQTIALPFTILLFVALLSNFAPVLVTILRRKHYRELPYVLISSWLYWSLIHTYFWGNVKGFLGIKGDWFKTPKTQGKVIKDPTAYSKKMLTVNIVSLLVFIALYAGEWVLYGWIDPYAFLWLPAMTIGISVLHR